MVDIVSVEYIIHVGTRKSISVGVVRDIEMSLSKNKLLSNAKYGVFNNHENFS